MSDDLKNRFFQLKLKELLNDETKPFPTFICEMETADIMEIVRIYCLFVPTMIPLTKEKLDPIVNEKLETKKVVDYGELYILVNPN